MILQVVANQVPGGDANDTNSANAQLACIALRSGAITFQCKHKYKYKMWGLILSMQLPEHYGTSISHVGSIIFFEGWR